MDYQEMWVIEYTFTNNCGSYGLTVWQNCVTMGLDLKIGFLHLTNHKKNEELEKKENGQAWVFFPLLFFSI